MNMIKWLNQNGETVATAPYIYNNGNEPSSYEWPADDTGFDTYMTQLLTAQGFLTPSASGLASKATAGETFDQAFWNFINSSSQPDKYSTRAWLMLGPAWAATLLTDNRNVSLTVEQGTQPIVGLHDNGKGRDVWHVSSQLLAQVD